MAGSRYEIRDGHVRSQRLPLVDIYRVDHDVHRRRHHQSPVSTRNRRRAIGILCGTVYHTGVRLEAYRTDRLTQFL